MQTGTYLLADVSVEISSIYDEVHLMCADYRTDRPAELHIATTAEEIEEESRMSDEQRAAEGLPPYRYEAPYLETLTVYRKLATLLMERGVLLMHGSVIAVDGEGYLFTALSGTGKSTHVRLWRRLFGKRAVMVNDDKPLVRVASHSTLFTPQTPQTPQTPHSSFRPLVYGTPWDGKHHLSNNIVVPLKAIVFLERGVENEIRAVDAKWIFPVLMQQTFHTDDPMGTLRVMQMLGTLAQGVKFYDLHCNMNPEAAEVAYNGMNI